METPSATFITMLMDRLHDLEIKNDRLEDQVKNLQTEQSQLRQELDNVLTDRNRLYLTLHTQYNEYSDGTEFVWVLGESVKIYDENESWYCDTEDKRYLDAIAFPSGIRIFVKIDEEKFDIFVGERGVPLTVEVLIDTFNKWMLTPLTETSNRTLKDILDEDYGAEGIALFGGFMPPTDNDSDHLGVIMRLR
jgi:hypothetical protein